MMVYPIYVHIILKSIRPWVREISGIKNIKKKGSFIVVCNHGSYVEDLVLPFIIKYKIGNYLHMYVNDKFFKNFFFRKILVGTNSIPIRVDKKTKRGKKVNEKAFKIALNYLKKKEMVGIFPEGHRSIEGKLMKAKTGAAKLALTAKVPVIPIGTIGTYDIWPKKSSFPRLKRCEVNIGKPIYLNKYFGKENNKKVLKEVTTLIMKKIAKLAKLEYNY